eukprot:37851-Pyramimonas_sp.AAC.1
MQVFVSVDYTVDELYPQLSGALQAFKVVAQERLVWSTFLEQAMLRHAQVLGLTFISYADRRGCCLQVDPSDDQRVVGVLQGVVDGQNRFWTHRPGGDQRYEKKVEHILRCVART